MEILKSTAVGLGLNYAVHIVSGLLYTHLCLPQNVHQILHSLVTTASPVCAATVNVMQASQQNYANVIMTAASVGVARSLLSG